MYYREFIPTDLSWLQIIAIVFGLTGGLYAFWKGYQYVFGKPKIRMHIADTVDLVLGVDGPVNRFHLGCAFENQGPKTGIVQYMDARVTDTNQNIGNFSWEFFVRYNEKTMDLERVPLTFRQAIPVKPNDISFQLIQFYGLTDDSSEFEWMVGQYSFEVRLWANEKSRDNDPSYVTKFQATISENFVERRTQSRKKAEYFSLDVPEWQ
jgi:hypothetical protein